jgi:exodeoxyribonuclease VII small subunit
MAKKKSFEEAFSSLEDIVKKMESGELSLDESLGAFEEAIKLVKFCNSELESAEQKVSILTEGTDGVITDEPFAKIDDAT